MNKLREIIKEKGFSYKGFAKRIDMRLPTLYCKLEGETEFKLSEIQKICKVLALKEEIFFQMFQKKEDI